jgi:urease accessory protein
MDEAMGKLFAWLSPGYPVGAFAFSHGLEWAVEAGDVSDRATLADWVGDLMRHGAGRTDAILAASACRAAGDEAALAEVAELAEALAPSGERRVETAALGAAFAEVTAAAWGGAAAAAAYPVAFGTAVARHGVPLEPALALYLQAFAANLVSAGIRLGVVGQTEGQRVQASLLPLCGEVAAEAVAATLDEVGGSVLAADIASMRHETQGTRLFRS